MTVLLIKLSNILWSLPFILAIFFTGTFLTIRLGVIQLRCFRESWKLLFRPEAQDGGEKISNFQALATTLSGTIGVGNIAGVATAITLGGPGSLFWMWVTALIGAATKFTSCALAHRYRRTVAEHTIGGPMITLEDGLGYKRLAFFFALFALGGAVSSGAMVQSNSIVSGIAYILPNVKHIGLWIGIISALFYAIVVIGGLKRIASVASLVVPFMSITYCFCALVVVLLNISALPDALLDILNSALNPWAATSGAVLAAIHYGVARALFASEAGLGTAPIAQAMVSTQDSREAGLIAMLGPFVDTLTICTLTGLVILVTGVSSVTSVHYEGAALSAYAFQTGLLPLGASFAQCGPVIVGVGLIFFAFTTMLAWSYYSAVCCEYVVGCKAAGRWFQWVMIAVIIYGSVASLNIVWAISDIANMLMILPNLFSLVLLSREAEAISVQS